MSLVPSLGWQSWVLAGQERLEKQANRQCASILLHQLLPPGSQFDLLLKLSPTDCNSGYISQINHFLPKFLFVILFQHSKGNSKTTRVCEAMGLVPYTKTIK